MADDRGNGGIEVVVMLTWRRREKGRWRWEEEREGGFGVAVEAEPPLRNEGHGGGRWCKAVENLDHQLIV